MLNFGPFMSFLFNSYIGNNENPPITDEICWSLDIRYCGAPLYAVIPSVGENLQRKITSLFEKKKKNQTKHLCPLASIFQIALRVTYLEMSDGLDGAIVILRVGGQKARVRVFRMIQEEPHQKVERDKR